MSIPPVVLDDMTILSGPSFGSGPMLDVTFTDGRKFVVVRSPVMNFTIRWRDAVPGYGTIYLKRQRATKTWAPQVGWVRGSYSSYVYPKGAFVDWHDALWVGLRSLKAWIDTPDWNGYQTAVNGSDSRLQEVIDTFGLSPIADIGTPDR